MGRVCKTINRDQVEIECLALENLVNKISSARNDLINTLKEAIESLYQDMVVTKNG